MEFFNKLREFIRVRLSQLKEKLDPYVTPIWTRIGPYIVRFLDFIKPIVNRMLQWLGGSWLTIITRLTLFGAACIIVLVGGVFIRYMYDRGEIIESLAKEKDWLQGRGERPAKPLIQILAADDTLIGEYLPRRESRIPLDACRTQMVWLSRAAVSSEDRHFFDHGGVSYRGILRAFWNNFKSFGLREGGGSITQQLARNLFIDRSTPGLIRKIYETFAAFLIESKLDKQEILCLYLNKIYMGEGRVGAEEASWFYFRKPPMNLDAAEAAMIVGLFPSPVRYSPVNNIRFSLRKQEKVLEALERDEFLKPGQQAAIIKQFKARYEIRENSSGTIGLYGASRDFRLNAAPAANDHVRQFLYENIPEEIVKEGGLVVRTTIEPRRQAAALDAMRRGIEKVRGDMIRSSKADADTTMQHVKRLNGALVSMDSTTGNLRAVVGGYGVVETGSSDRIWKMLRQPGSVIKGFLYATALDAGVRKLDDEVTDEATVIDGYAPRNWYPHFKGKMPLRKAVAMSVNTVAVRTLHDLGVSNFRDRLGSALELSYFDARQRFPANLTLALGSGEVTPLELTRIYAILLNKGGTVRPSLIKSVKDKDGTILWEGTPTGSSNILSETAAAEAIDLMTSVVDPEDEGTAGWIGQQRARNPKFLPFPVAGKSGTVQTVAEVQKKFPGLRGVHDAWFVALVPGEVSVVWIGQDEGAPFPGGGAATAGSIWAEFANISFKDVSGSFPPVTHKEIEPKPPEDLPITPVTPENNTEPPNG